MDFNPIDEARWLVQEYGKYVEETTPREKHVSDNYILGVGDIRTNYSKWPDGFAEFHIYFRDMMVYFEKGFDGKMDCMLRECGDWENFFRQEWFDFSKKTIVNAH